MILILLILSLFIGGALAWLAGRWSAVWPRWIALATLGLQLAGLLAIWASAFAPGADLLQQTSWPLEVALPWIPQLGISLHLGMDGLSLLLVVLTNVLGIAAVAASWSGIQTRVGFFHFNLLWMLAALVGVFLALDLFLFYFFWEMMLIPLYFLIAIWGHERRTYAAIKFFLFTQASGLLMLLGIVGLALVHQQSTGVLTFDYTQLLGTAMPETVGLLLFLGFFIAFIVKLPAVPLHTWLPDAHTEAPTAGSVGLAGLVLKAGAYGLLRLALPLFPDAAAQLAPVAMVLGLIGIIYGALLAFGQTDLKRLVAYSSVSHMGFVLMGIFAWNQLALQGALIIILSHGISTGALFILVGDLDNRTHTRDMRQFGGLWETAPRMGGLGMVLTLASLGLPSLGNFVGEFLVLLGVYQVSMPLAALATLGFVVATIYSLAIMQRTFFGPNRKPWKLADSNRRELAILGTMIAILLWLGLFPQTVIDTAGPALAVVGSYNPAAPAVVWQADDPAAGQEVEALARGTPAELVPLNWLNLPAAPDSGTAAQQGGAP